MKSLFLISIAIALLASVHSEAQSFKWAFSAGNHVDDANIGIETDQEGNVYTLGLISWGSVGNAHANFQAYHITKQNKDGLHLWSKFMIYKPSMRIYDFKLYDNKLYVAGEFGDNFVYDGKAYNPGSNTQSNVLCVNTDGEYQWVTGYQFYVRGIYANNDGLFLSGFFVNSLKLGRYAHYSFSHKLHNFLLKLDDDHEVVWGAFSLGTLAPYVTSDSKGNIYIAGYGESFPFSINDITYTAQNSSFIAKYSKDGVLIWVEYFYTEYGRNNPTDIVVDGDDNVIVAFDNVGKAIFHDFSIYMVGTILLKFNENGRRMWKRTFNGADNCKLATDADNGIIAAFSRNSISVIDDYPGEVLQLPAGSLLIVKFHPLGFQQWARVGGGTANSITAGLNNLFYITGSYTSHSLNFDGNVITNNSGNNCSDMFTVCIEDPTSIYCPEHTPTLFSDTPDFCEGDTVIVKLKQSYDATFHWTVNGSSITNSDSTLFINQSGAYQLFINKNSLCPVQTEVFSMNMHPLPYAKIEDLEKTVLCPDETIVLKTRNDNDYTFKWFLNDNLIPSQEDSLLTVSIAGKYKIEVRNRFCESSDSIKVTKKTMPFVVFSKDTIIYAGYSAFLNPNSYSNLNLKWYYNFDKNEFSKNLNLSTMLIGNYLVTAENECGIDVANIVLAIKDTSNIDLIPESTLFYPNPCSEFLNVRLGSFNKGPIIIKITDLMGRTILHKMDVLTENKTVTINTQQIAAGQYIVWISNDTSQTAQKINVR